MKRLLVHILRTFVVLLVAAPDVALGVEFAPFGVTKLDKNRPNIGGRQPIDMRDKPDVYLGTNCKQRKDENCPLIVKNQNGEKISSFKHYIDLDVLAKSHYHYSAYLLLRRRHQCGLSICSEVILYEDNGVSKRVAQDYAHKLKGKQLELSVTPGETLIILTPASMTEVTLTGNVKRRLVTPEKLKRAKIEHGLDGNIAIIAIGANNAVWLSNGQKWFNADLRLTEYGDRQGIWDVRPSGSSSVIGVVYRYVNSYNKGLYVTSAGPGQRNTQTKPIFLSTQRNVGFDPKLFVDDGVHVIARDRTNGNKIAIKFQESELSQVSPPPAGTFPRWEKWAEFWVGAGVQSRRWIAYSRVPESAETNNAFAEVDYRIDQSLLRSYQLRGRLGDKKLAVIYLKSIGKNQTDSPIRSSAVNYGFEQFTGLVTAPDLNLKLAYRWNSVQGIAKFKGSRKSQDHAFTATYNQLGMYWQANRGAFAGFEYTKFSAPNAVGFSGSNKKVIFDALDPNLGIQTLGAVVGYDHEAYAKRYETDYFDWFVSGKAGVVAAAFNISDDVKDRAKSLTGYDEVRFPWGAGVTGTAETGILWQRRSSALRGLGLQAAVGYRAQGRRISTGEPIKSDSESKLSLIFFRNDLWHGPFININAVF